MVFGELSPQGPSYQVVERDHFCSTLQDASIETLIAKIGRELTEWEQIRFLAILTIFYDIFWSLLLWSLVLSPRATQEKSNWCQINFKCWAKFASQEVCSNPQNKNFSHRLKMHGSGGKSGKKSYRSLLVYQDR